MAQDTAALVREALESGFSQAGALYMDALRPDPGVLEMCSERTCTQYGRNWRCPPGCESLDEAAARLGAYTRGVLVQTTGYLEDDFDVETMDGTYAEHEKRFAALVKALRGRYPEVLPLGAAACAVCGPCTYPEAPCRFPELAISPLEAYGLLVSKLCAASGMRYHYGRRTLTYTSCYLLK